METIITGYMGGCQNYGPFLGTLDIKCRIVIGIQKGTIILTTTHMPTIFLGFSAFGPHWHSSPFISI